MRLASYNVLHGKPVHAADAISVGSQETSDPRFLVEAIQLLGPDVLGLQEVDRHQERSGGIDQAAHAAEAMEADSWRFVPTVVGTPGGRGGFRSSSQAEIAAAIDGHVDPSVPQYGIALASRLPVSSWRTKVLAPARVSLPLLVQANGKARIMQVRDEQRAAIAAVIETEDGPITVVVTHLSFVPGFNLRQLRHVTRWMRTLPGPQVLIGDFNLPGALPQRASKFAGVVSEPTFPSYLPRVQLDHILVHGFTEDAITTMRESAQVISAGVSDHRAVVAEIPVVPRAPRR